LALLALSFYRGLVKEIDGGILIRFMKKNYKIPQAVLCLSVTLLPFKMNAGKTEDP